MQVSPLWPEEWAVLLSGRMDWHLLQRMLASSGSDQDRVCMKRLAVFLLACKSGFYGRDCKKSCDCQPSAVSCDGVTGICTCSKGFKGKQCDQGNINASFPSEICLSICLSIVYPFSVQIFFTCLFFLWAVSELKNIYIECDEGTYGTNCSQTCNCKNGATCDKVSGQCNCPPGYSPPT
jgi:hypothetical protein